MKDFYKQAFLLYVDDKKIKILCVSFHISCAYSNSNAALDDTVELWNFLLRDRFSHYNDWIEFLQVLFWSILFSYSLILLRPARSNLFSWTHISFSTTSLKKLNQIFQIMNSLPVWFYNPFRLLSELHRIGSWPLLIDYFVQWMLSGKTKLPTEEELNPWSFSCFICKKILLVVVYIHYFEWSPVLESITMNTFPFHWLFLLIVPICSLLSIDYCSEGHFLCI